MTSRYSPTGRAALESLPIENRISSVRMSYPATANTATRPRPPITNLFSRLHLGSASSIAESFYHVMFKINFALTPDLMPLRVTQAKRDSGPAPRRDFNYHRRSKGAKRHRRNAR